MVADGEFVGIITSYDLWKNHKDPNIESDQKVKDVMNTNVIYITPMDKIGTAAKIFLDKRFKTLPVVNLRNELKGVVTAFDIIRRVISYEYNKKHHKDKVIKNTIK